VAVAEGLGPRSPRGVTGVSIFRLSMVLSENRLPPRIKSGAGFFGIMR
jgi:hypothetical protein